MATPTAVPGSVPQDRTDLLDNFVKTVVSQVGATRGLKEASDELVRTLRLKAEAEDEVDRLENREESLRCDIHTLKKVGYR